MVGALINGATLALLVVPFIFIGFPLVIAIMAAAYELLTDEEGAAEEETATPPVAE